MLKKTLVTLVVLVSFGLILAIYFYQNKSNIVWINYSEDMFVKVEEVASGLGIPW